MSHTNLSAAEIALLDTQLPDIGGAIRGKPVTPDGHGWRVGSSTKISKNGRWFDFKAEQGGFGAASLIAHCLACTPEEAIAWAQSWLAQHPQAGPCSEAFEDDVAGEDDADTLQRRAYIETYAAPAARRRPPQRRSSVTFELNFWGQKFAVGIGYYPDGDGPGRTQPRHLTREARRLDLAADRRRMHAIQIRQVNQTEAQLEIARCERKW